MKKIILSIALLFLPIAVFAQESPEVDSVPIEKYAIGKVTEIAAEHTSEAGGFKQIEQQIRVEILSGEEKGQTVDIIHGGAFIINEQQKVKVGEKIVVGKTETAEGIIYFVAETFRLPWIAGIFVLFAALVIFFGRLKGFGSLVGMSVSITVLALFIVPRILNGADPLATSLLGALITVVLSLYLAHGFSKQTSISLFSTVLILALVGALAVAFVTISRLFGFGSEEAYYLQLLQSNTIDLRGLLLGGIIIGVLGVLDDVTTAQTAAVFELKKANEGFGFVDLYKSAMRIGREHISSLVNTLVLAYAGASFPLLLVFSLNKNIPLWATLNSELVSEEIVRALVGSTALVLAVPIATAIAAWFAGRKQLAKQSTS